MPPCPTVHLAAEQSLVQAVRGGLLQPLLHRGSVQADVILRGGGLRDVTPRTETDWGEKRRIWTWLTLR